MPSLMAYLGLNASGFEAGAHRSVQTAHSAGAEISSAFGEAISEKLTELASVGALEELARKTIEYAEQVSLLSQRLGISTDAVQEWDYALKMSGSTVQSAVPFFEKLAVARKKALEGKDESIAAFKNLGVAIDDLKHKRLEEIAQQIAETFKGADPQALIADLREVGGRGAGEMVAAFRDGLADLVNEAQGKGVVIGNEVIEGLREAADSAKGVWMEMVAGVAPAINFIAEAFKRTWRVAKVITETVINPGGVDEMRNKYLEEDKAAEKRKEDRKQGHAPVDLEGGESKAEANAAKHAAAEEERLEDHLAKLKDKNALAGMSKEEKLAAFRLRKRQAEDVAGTPGMDKAERLKAQIAAAEAQGDIDSLMNKAEKKQRSGHADVNHLQSIGAYGPARDGMADAVKEIAGHVRQFAGRAHQHQHHADRGRNVPGFGRH